MTLALDSRAATASTQLEQGPPSQRLAHYAVDRPCAVRVGLHSALGGCPSYHLASEQSPRRSVPSRGCLVSLAIVVGGRRIASETPSCWQWLSPPGLRVGLRVRPPDLTLPRVATAVQLAHGLAVFGFLEPARSRACVLAWAQATLLSHSG